MSHSSWMIIVPKAQKHQRKAILAWSERVWWRCCHPRGIWRAEIFVSLPWMSGAFYLSADWGPARAGKPKLLQAVVNEVCTAHWHLQPLSSIGANKAAGSYRLTIWHAAEARRTKKRKNRATRTYWYVCHKLPLLKKIVLTRFPLYLNANSIQWWPQSLLTRTV